MCISKQGERVWTCVQQARCHDLSRVADTLQCKTFPNFMFYMPSYSYFKEKKNVSESFHKFVRNTVCSQAI